MFSKMIAKAVIKKFVEVPVVAMHQEFRQLYDSSMPGNPLFEAINAEHVNIQQRIEALNVVHLVKQKRGGNRLKGHFICTGGSNQKKHLNDGITIASPIV